MGYGVCSIDMCEKPVPARRARIGMCEGHYKRQWRHGDPAAGRAPNGTPIAVRFWQFVTPAGDNDCWEWQGARMHGYGCIRDGARNVQAHRLAWKMATGQRIPTGMVICHHCDNPPCVNAAHLFLGTPRDNVIDAVAKGRHSTPDVTRRWAKARAA